MFSGQLLGIAIAPEAGAPMSEVAEIEAVPGKGLLGDRYAEEKGAFQRGCIESGQQVTLIEIEAIIAAADDCDRPINHLSTRRNLLTRNVPLNHLVGCEFWVGDVKLRGTKLCEPCKYLEKLSGPGYLEALKHRGGLRADVLHGGTLRVGAEIRAATSGS